MLKKSRGVEGVPHTTRRTNQGENLGKDCSERKSEGICSGKATGGMGDEEDRPHETFKAFFSLEMSLFQSNAYHHSLSFPRCMERARCMFSFRMMFYTVPCNHGLKCLASAFNILCSISIDQLKNTPSAEGSQHNYFSLSVGSTAYCLLYTVAA